LPLFKKNVKRSADFIISSFWFSHTPLILEYEMRYVTSKEVSKFSGISYRQTLHDIFLMHKWLALLNYSGLFLISFSGLLFPTIWLTTSPVFVGWGTCVLFIVITSIVFSGFVLNPLVLKFISSQRGYPKKEIF